MQETIDCFLPCCDFDALSNTLRQLRGSRMIRHINLIVTQEFAMQNSVPDDCSFIVIDSLKSSLTMHSIADNILADYALIFLTEKPVNLGQYSIQRMARVMSETDAALVYSDRWTIKNGITENHPVIDWQVGSIRDDFDFGSLVMTRSSLLHNFASEVTDNGYRYAGWYELWLYLSRNGSIFHINEYLYTEEELDLRDSGVKQFDYVNPANRDVQIEMEEVVTAHLKAIDALVDTSSYSEPDFAEQDFNVEATVVIPVRNREKTICDAVNSALGQKTSFDFNVIVVDNHSTDMTTKLLDEYDDKRLIHIIPKRTNLGIGGCWNVAVDDSRCGRFAVQLDSDDLYSSPNTLQTIIDAFYDQHAAMIVGSYRMCDFSLKTLPPGLINHAEWTETNGCNNALRINGLGAPRAFFTPLLRQIRFPNTSYGEDYALGLAFSRRFRIGRIFTELYLCRRWSGNSDAALSIDKVNANNLYKDRLRTMEIMARRKMNAGKGGTLEDNSLWRFFNRQLETWDIARQNFRDLQDVKTKGLIISNNEIGTSENSSEQFDAISPLTLKLQYNPARIVSTGASINKEAIKKRPCFLCRANRPKQQISTCFGKDYEILVNPYPILPIHFTIPAIDHRPQRIAERFEDILLFLSRHTDMTIFYNGPQCGASAPDHMHFQAGTSGVLPLQAAWTKLQRSLKRLFTLDDNNDISLIEGWVSPALLIRSNNLYAGKQLFKYVYDALPISEEQPEPMMNIISWMYEGLYLSVIFPRGKHRPDCYYAENDKQILVSPGALDMSGLIITPRKEDFDRITPSEVVKILREVSLPCEEFKSLTAKIQKYGYDKSEDKVLSKEAGEPDVQVGIVSASCVDFSLNGKYVAKGEVNTGKQHVEFSEGGILWNGNLYRELTFSPYEEGVSFSLDNVTIGINFHWQRQERQTFEGTLKLVVEADKVCAINCLPVEKYLTSVISSEMKSTSSLELLKAHAVISRSWLLAQIERRRNQDAGGSGFFSFVKKDDELIRWYDRDDHTIFDVCADDHCQRYQGITKANNVHVEQAVKETCGEILTYNDKICDARFSKCCGGITEEFQYCWENTPQPYLVALRDCDDKHADLPDLSNEAEAEKWIRAFPESYCNTNDKKILSQVLNDYDQETSDFYRWKVEYSQDELSHLIEDKLKIEFGQIVDLVPVERGRSGRICKLKIIGTKRTFTIGKELEIRRALSKTHLYSSAFVVDKLDVVDNIPSRFVLHGAGWGHGVGLCQIGAAMMGEKGYKYDEILLHYYRGAEIKKIYS